MMQGDLMRKLFKSKKGMTLIEVITSLAVLGIISVPLMMSFTNTIMVVKLTQKQTEINAVTRIVKNNVTDAVKYGIKLIKYGAVPRADGTMDPADEIQLRGPSSVFTAAVDTTPDLKIDGKDGISDYSAYKFSVKDLKTADSDYPNTYEYVITLKKANGDVIQKVRIAVNIVPEV